MREKIKDLIRYFVPDFILKHRRRIWIEKLMSRSGIDSAAVDSSIIADWNTQHKKLTIEQWIGVYNIGKKLGLHSCIEEQDVRLIIGHIPQGTSSILDAGSGDGTLAIALARRGWAVTGVDCSDEAISLAEEKTKSANCNIEYRQGFLETLPFPDKSFDAVICSHTLEHVADLSKAISELKRVGRKGLIIVVPIEKPKRQSVLHVNCFTKIEDLQNKLNIEKCLSFTYRKRKPDGSLDREQIFVSSEL
jgi:ubiquinone/menaquinone biosynthesis C-methylase UbiE